MRDFVWLCGMIMLFCGGALCSTGEMKPSMAGIFVAVVGAMIIAQGTE